MSIQNEPIADDVWNMSLQMNLTSAQRKLLQEASIKLHAFERIEPAMVAYKQRMRQFNKDRSEA